MAETTLIAWTQKTFNAWIGCTKVHTGCQRCYAEGFAKRTGKAIWGDAGSRTKTSEKYWRDPIKWNAAAEKSGVRCRVFCSSLADVFEDWQGPMLHHNGDVLHWRDDLGVSPLRDAVADTRQATMNDVRSMLFKLIDATPWLDWLLLTKRPENIRKMWPTEDDGHGGRLSQVIFAKGDPWDAKPGKLVRRRDNVWLGTSVSDQDTANEWIPRHLKNRSLSPVLFVSCEPMVGPIDFCAIQTPNLKEGLRFDSLKAHNDDRYAESDAHLDWIIVGGESGSGYRPMDHAWARAVRDQCKTAGVPFFFKQSAAYKTELGIELDGEIIREFPQPQVSIGGRLW